MILNLVNKQKSEIRYEHSQFPDGQQQIEITEKSNNDSVIIWSRFNNFMDLEKIICAVKSVKMCAFNRVALRVPYFLGGRSDRSFSKTENNYLRDVVCPIINSLNLDYVLVRDPHSHSIETGTIGFKEESNDDFYNWAIRKISPVNYTVICPDAGAVKRTVHASKVFGHGKLPIVCEKERNSAGEITKTIVPHFDPCDDVVILDDICDGGRTFIEIAKVIKLRHEQREREDVIDQNGKIYLIVTHGIFSKGFDELSKYFDGIFCTNSYSDVNHKLVKQFNLF